jgi:AcrR family transcriptional regulator
MPPPAARSDQHGSLSRPVIVDAALAIVDRDGLAKLTMRRLGSELGVEAMSIYHHVPNKATLLELLVGELLRDVDVIDGSESPLELVERFSRQLRVSLLGHPHLAPLAAVQLPGSLFRADASVMVRERLISFGFDTEAASWIVESFVAFTVGQVLVAVTAGPGTSAATAAAEDDAVYETGLRFLLAGLREELGI